MSLEKWQIFDTGIASAEKNMAIDAALLDSLSEGDRRPILHLYDWDHPSATYGHFINPGKLLQEQALEGRLQLARRPTGGGIIFHLADVAFSVLVPASHSGYSDNVMENYAFVNRSVIKAIELFTDGSASPTLMPIEPAAADAQAHYFCMAKPTKYDVMLNGRKVGGGAQRRTKHGFLHQGSISLAFPDESLLRDALLPGTKILDAMQTQTCSLLDGAPTLQQLADAQRTMRVLLAQIFVNASC